MSGLDIYNPNTEFQFQYYNTGTTRGAVLNPSQTLQMGVFKLDLKDLKTSLGHKYFWIQLNNTMIPQMIQITDNRLICSIEEDYQPVRYQDCSSGVNLEFGKIGFYQPK